jgi:hypothetical protein
MKPLAHLAALLAPMRPDDVATAKRFLEEAEVSHDELRRNLQVAIKAAKGMPIPGYYCWIRDVFDDRVVYEEETPTGTTLYEQSYTVADDGSVTLGGTPAKVKASTVYVVVKEGAAADDEPGLLERQFSADQRSRPGAEDLEEATMDLVGDVVPLVERAVRKDGSFKVKLIQPGWGSSGYYSAEVLKRDGPAVFPKGTKMYWDHPTVTEAKERPERSLKDLAAELTSAATYAENGPDGPGLYAEGKGFGAFTGSIEELAPHIGSSIRAWGKAKAGVAEGRKGKVIEALTPSPETSVDFVTQAGAGGKVLQLFEAARGRAVSESLTEGDDVSEQELKEARDALAEAQRERDEERAKNARHTEAATLREARDVVTEALAKVEMPDITRTRLAEQLAKNPPTKDGSLDRDALATALTEAVKAEAAYLAQITGSGRIRGMGAAGDGAAIEESTKRLEAALGRGFGLSEAGAKIAAGGRSH